MVGRIERVDVEFIAFDENMAMSAISHSASTQQELMQIENLFFIHYQGKGYKMHKTRIRKCSCGKHVSCDCFTNTCACGRDYSMDGSLLAPRHFWGEETGEHWTECY